MDLGLRGRGHLLGQLIPGPELDRPGPVLVAWERGLGTGHLERLRPIVDALVREGFFVVFAHPAKGLCRQALPVPRENLRLLSLPPPPPPQAMRPALSFAENLYGNMYRHPDWERDHLPWWQELFDRLRPRLFVMDFAHGPAALARNRGIPVIAVGTGFTLPAPRRPMPRIEPWFPVAEAKLTERAAEIHESLSAVFRRGGEAPPPPLVELLEDMDRLLCTVPELDHCGPRPDGRYLGPMSRGDGAPLPPWPRGRERAFVYLRAYDGRLHDVLAALAARDAAVQAWIPDATAADLARHARPGLRLLEGPARVAHVVAEADYAVNYGGSGLGHGLLLGGVPLFMLPHQAEQNLWSYRVMEAGLGVGLQLHDRRGTAAERLDELRNRPEIPAAVAAFARRHARLSPERALETVMACCRERLGL